MITQRALSFTLNVGLVYIIFSIFAGMITALLAYFSLILIASGWKEH